MNLQEIGIKYNTDKAFFHHYLDFYQENLPDSSFSGGLLEIGVMDGASLRMWREYYPKADIVGIDIDDKSHIEIDGVQILQMDGTNSDQIADMIHFTPSFDIIIDDGSHMTADQIKSFCLLYNAHLNSGGYYIIEDLHTSLMPNYVNSDLDTIEWLNKQKLNATYYRRDAKVADSMTCIIPAGQKIVT